MARRSSNAYYYYLWLVLFHRNEAISVLSSIFFSSRTGSLEAQRIRFSSNKIANDTQNLCRTPIRHVIHNTCIMYIGLWYRNMESTRMEWNFKGREEKKWRKRPCGEKIKSNATTPLAHIVACRSMFALNVYCLYIIEAACVSMRSTVSNTIRSCGPTNLHSPYSPNHKLTYAELRWMLVANICIVRHERKWYIFSWLAWTNDFIYLFIRTQMSHVELRIKCWSLTTHTHTIDFHGKIMNVHEMTCNTVRWHIASSQSAVGHCLVEPPLVL